MPSRPVRILSPLARLVSADGVWNSRGMGCCLLQMGAGRPQSNSFTMNPVQLADVEYGHSAAPSPASMPRPPLPEMLPLPPSHPVRPAYTGWGDAPAPEQVRTRSHRAPANDGGRSDQIMSTPPPLPRSMSGRDSKQRPQAQLQLHQPYPEAAVEEAV